MFGAKYIKPGTTALDLSSCFDMEFRAAFTAFTKFFTRLTKVAWDQRLDVEYSHPNWKYMAPAPDKPKGLLPIGWVPQDRDKAEKEEEHDAILQSVDGGVRAELEAVWAMSAHDGVKTLQRKSLELADNDEQAETSSGSEGGCVLMAFNAEKKSGSGGRSLIRRRKRVLDVD